MRTPKPEDWTPRDNSEYVEVSKDDFFQVMNQLDVHPYPRHPNRSMWELRNRTLIGVSVPGWRNPGSPRGHYLLRKYAPKGVTT